MKKILTILILACIFTTTAQNNNQAINPGSTKAKSKLSSARVNSLTYPLKHDTCLDKEFSLVFYVLLDSSGAPGVATTASLNLMLTNINKAFARICVKFVNCTTIFIPMHPFNKWNRIMTQPLITAQYYTDKTINMYFPDTVLNNAGEKGGYTYSVSPTSTLATQYNTPVKDLIVVLKTGIFMEDSAIPIHMLGHFFGLPHTHGEINGNSPASPPPPVGSNSHEFVNGTNCSSVVTNIPHGDGFCDTEADPGENGPTADGMGNFYIRPYDNYMSHYNGRCHFTQEQYNYMASYILKHSRLYLH